MKVYNGIEEFKGNGNSIVTIGTFDGVHEGHRTILHRLKELAHLKQGETVIITFWPHPRMIISSDKPVYLINTFEEKAELLDNFGIDHLIKIPFTREFSLKTADEFIQNVLITAIQTKVLVIGHDHRFGKDRTGDFDYLKKNEQKNGFIVEEIPPQDVENITVSSSKIRKALLEGNVVTANQYLGSTYSITGIITTGDKIGREIGFPTANILVNYPGKLIPGDGVYVVKVLVENKWHGGMLYIGKRPTLQGVQRTIEVHIFNFNKEIYGESISVQFLKNIRGDQTFGSLEELKKQLQRDEIAAKEILKKNGY